MPKKDPLLWDQDLDWYLNCSDSAIGYRSKDRVKFLYAVIAGLTAIIIAFMALKAFGVW